MDKTFSDDAITRLKREATNPDHEAAHVNADSILCFLILGTRKSSRNMLQ